MRKFAVAVVLLALVGFGVFWFLTAPSPVIARTDDRLETGGDVARGREIFFAGGCASCHATPKQDDALRLGGGLELKSPFGSFYAPNISSHPTDGIGRWRAADLANAMMAGVSPEGAHYYPAFPYASYARMKIDDVRDLMAFLRTTPPVEGKAPAHGLGFPFNIRRTLGVWKAMFMDRTPVRDDPAQTPEWNRGRYLTEALSHCAECHSPRNALGGIVATQRYAGGPELEGDGWVPNITPHRLKDWTKADMEQLLQIGITPEGDSVGGSMGSVVKNMSQLSAADRGAIAAYIVSLPAREGPARPANR